MKGNNVPTTNTTTMKPATVTRASSQFHVKATIREAMMSAEYSMKVPSFSDTPDCKVLLPDVIVPAAAQPGENQGPGRSDRKGA